MGIVLAQVGEQSSIRASKEVGQRHGGERWGDASTQLRTLALNCFCSPVSPMLEENLTSPVIVAWPSPWTAWYMKYIRNLTSDRTYLFLLCFFMFICKLLQAHKQLVEPRLLMCLFVCYYISICNWDCICFCFCNLYSVKYEPVIVHN